MIRNMKVTIPRSIPYAFSNPYLLRLPLLATCLDSQSVYANSPVTWSLFTHVRCVSRSTHGNEAPWHTYVSSASLSVFGSHVCAWSGSSNTAFAACLISSPTAGWDLRWLEVSWGRSNIIIRRLGAILELPRNSSRISYQELIVLPPAFMSENKLVP